jgi:hypothetical protein
VTILDQTFASDSTLMREAHSGASESIVLGPETQNYDVNNYE